MPEGKPESYHILPVCKHCEHSKNIPVCGVKQVTCTFGLSESETTELYANYEYKRKVHKNGTCAEFKPDYRF